MTAAHVFMGEGYYPMSGLGDYKYSFYGDEAVGDAERYVLDFFKSTGHDWWVVVTDNGDGLRLHDEGWKG